MRVAFIGDVHGHATAFMKLLRRLEDYGVDRIVQLGDLVDRGPASIECVRISRTWKFQARGDGKRSPVERKIECVIGNHDNNYLYGRRHWQMPTRGFFPRFTEKAVGEGLSKADINWLAGLPYFIEIPELGLTGVHGGIPPHWKGPLSADRTSGFHMTRCGFIGPNGKLLSPGSYSSKFWADDYDGRYGYVVFGHTSFKSVTYFKHAVGVDTSKFGSISAVVVSNEDKRMVTEFSEKSSGSSWGSASSSTYKTYSAKTYGSDKKSYLTSPSQSVKITEELTEEDFDDLAAQLSSKQFDRDCGLCGDIFAPGEKQLSLSDFPGEVFHKDCIDSSCLDTDSGFGD